MSKKGCVSAAGHNGISYYLFNSKNVGQLQKERVSLGACFTESRSSLLVDKLHQAEGRLKAIDQNGLNIVLFNT